MSTDEDPDRWARLRFAIIGPLLAAPQQPGALRQALQAIARKSWRHPTTGAAVRFSYATVERWYYAARAAQDPVAVLRRRRRRRQDAGRARRLPAPLIQALEAQYREHPGWTVQLHYDNLVARAEQEEALRPVPAYSTIRRYLRRQGHHRKPRPKRATPGPGRPRNAWNAWRCAATRPSTSMACGTVISTTAPSGY